MGQHRLSAICWLGWDNHNPHLLQKHHPRGLTLKVRAQLCPAKALTLSWLCLQLESAPTGQQCPCPPLTFSVLLMMVCRGSSSLLSAVCVLYVRPAETQVAGTLCRRLQQRSISLGRHAGPLARRYNSGCFSKRHKDQQQQESSLKAPFQ